MAQSPPVTLETGAYDILRQRLETQAADLRSRMDQLNAARKTLFGAREPQLAATNHVTTDNNCLPRDMAAIGHTLLLGYNVHIGLRTGVKLQDVFSAYQFDAQSLSFQPLSLELIQDARFEEDFSNLYKYYRETVFAKFAFIGPNLFMVFQTGKTIADIRTFKWTVRDGALTYQGNRFDHEFRYPDQHEFQWKRTTREMHRKGVHPHVSIEDRIFIETIGGDFTVKVEDNTDTGKGIFSEPVANPDQTLDDAEMYYALVGNLIVLKVKPYQERDFRYVVVNEKMATAVRIDALQDACVLLPDQQGIIFPAGYYLQTGGYKLFDKITPGLQFEKRLSSPNGEDFLYVFNHAAQGIYTLFPYNLVAQQADTPIVCNGYSVFPGGQLCYFRAEAEPGRRHTIQVWNTPYGDTAAQQPEARDSWLARVGNKDLVKGLAECRELLTLLEKPDPYASLYIDVVKKASDIIDGYYWIKNQEAFSLSEPLGGIRDAASAAIDEYEKVRRLQSLARESVDAFAEKAKTLLDKVRRHGAREVDEFVANLGGLRALKGEVVTLREMRYADLAQLSALETQITGQSQELALACGAFLLRPEALKPYQDRAARLRTEAEAVKKVADAQKTNQALDEAARQLELLIETVGGLPMEDATQTTAIIDRISVLFAEINAIRSGLRSRQTELRKGEATAGFQAQIRLFSQSIANYLELSDTPEKCDEYLTRLTVQLEELDGKFADLEGFAIEIAQKREEVVQVFESKRVTLVEARNRRSASLAEAGDRILKGMRQRLLRMQSAEEINAYLAADVMAAKVRDLATQLEGLSDPARGAELLSRMQGLREEALRQLRDRKELFEDQENVLRLGNFRFAVQQHPLEATVALQEGQLCYHLTGTRFFEPITHPDIEAARAVWTQALPSENDQVYRAEYLALHTFRSLPALPKPGEALDELVRLCMAERFQEGYVKGVHDYDAARILESMLRLRTGLGLLAFAPGVRALARLFWYSGLVPETQAVWKARIQAADALRKLAPDSELAATVRAGLTELLAAFAENGWGKAAHAPAAADYLLDQLPRTQEPPISQLGGSLYKGFFTFLKRTQATTAFQQQVQALAHLGLERYQLIHGWVQSYAAREQVQDLHGAAAEAAALIFMDVWKEKDVHVAPSTESLTGLRGEHALIQGGAYMLDYHSFWEKIQHFDQVTAPAFRSFASLKSRLVQDFARQIRIEDFKPRPMSGFVRNRLIDQVYLPLIGANLAKQIGTAGEQSRTDRMGMLLLISPPGYGKTTLVEYVAQRLGLIFMKINGPALGHQVTSLDPGTAPNAAAREELEKLNLAFEMGDNVMICVDDIQHTHPEFLQKFISLCDAQRKVEGVYKGKSRTYDFRGRRLAIVMAGNPYTEQGTQFTIPDMLANRADVYNLGDMLGGHEAAFRLSYLENSLTANPVLAPLASRPPEDLYTLYRVAETGDLAAAEFTSSFSPDELQDALSVLKKMLTVREVVLKVNQTYISSAAQAEAYRREPPFRLQGSYRNMGRLAEKVSPVMNDAELDALIMGHYEAESQTLASGAEANVLAFKRLMGRLTEADQQRWQEICRIFLETKALNADYMAQMVREIGAFTGHMEAIRKVLEGK